MSQILEQAEKLLQALPKEQLGFFPTPFYRLDRLSEELGVNLFIKRDDFTGMNLFGGNKVRKLEYLLGEAKAKGCEYAYLRRYPVQPCYGDSSSLAADAGSNLPLSDCSSRAG